MDHSSIGYADVGEGSAGIGADTLCYSAIPQR